MQRAGKEVRKAARQQVRKRARDILQEGKGRSTEQEEQGGGEGRKTDGGCGGGGGGGAGGRQGSADTRDHQQQPQRKKSRQQQKREVREERQRGKDKGSGGGGAGGDAGGGTATYDVVRDAKTLWNDVRRKAISASERARLLQQLYTRVRGKVVTIVRRHDASRVVQTLLAHGTPHMVETVMEEMLPVLPEIAKEQYAHFSVLKLVDVAVVGGVATRVATGGKQSEGQEEAEGAGLGGGGGGQGQSRGNRAGSGGNSGSSSGAERLAQQQRIGRALKGHIVSLATHVIGARVVEKIFAEFRPAVARALWVEMYGRQQATLADIDKFLPTTLAQALERRPTKQSKETLLDDAAHMVTRLNRKVLTAFAYAARFIWEYLQVTPVSVTVSLTDTLADRMSDMLSTRPGSLVMARCASYASQKHRVRMMKAIKGHVLEALSNDFGYLPILRLLDTTDDTLSLRQHMLDELFAHCADAAQPVFSAHGELVDMDLPPLAKAACLRGGSKVILYMLCPELHGRYFDTAERDLLQPAEPMQDADGKEQEPVTKRSARVRHAELLRYVQEPLRQTCEAHAEAIARTKYGSMVLEELIKVVGAETTLHALCNVLFPGSYEVEFSGAADAEEEAGEDSVDGEHGDDSDEEKQEEEEEEEDENGTDEGEAPEHNDEQKMLTEAAHFSAQQQPTWQYDLPAHEDPFVHSLLKRVLRFEAGLASSSQGKGEEQGRGGAAPRTAWLWCFLLDCLSREEEEYLAAWIGANRSSLILAEIAKVNDEARERTLEILRPHEAQLSAQAANMAGSRVLTELLSASATSAATAAAAATDGDGSEKTDKKKKATKAKKSKR